jgi:hypothetical protein
MEVALHVLARRCGLDPRRTPIPNAIHSTVQIGEKAVRKALAGEPVADSSLTACGTGS